MTELSAQFQQELEQLAAFAKLVMAKTARAALDANRAREPIGGLLCAYETLKCIGERLDELAKAAAQQKPPGYELVLLNADEVDDLLREEDIDGWELDVSG